LLPFAEKVLPKLWAHVPLDATTSQKIQLPAGRKRSRSY
jgi:hypothetical protein